jgi:hypothetical protein
MNKERHGNFLFTCI